MDDKTLKVDDFSTKSVVTVKPWTYYVDLVRLMKENDFRHLPVLEDEQLVGIISERDLKFSFEHSDFVDIQARDIMNPEPYAVLPETPLAEVVKEMSERKIGSAIIRDPKNQISGLFTTTDALNTLRKLISTAE